jgi:hypothetical protein
MKNIILYFLLLVLLAGCDAVQNAEGVVVDKLSKQPLDSVAIGKQEKGDPSNPFTRRIYSQRDGVFKYSGIGGTNNVELYFTKSGYTTISIEYTASNRSDTVYLQKISK